jgi:HEPN domain-containing protein
MAIEEVAGWLVVVDDDLKQVVNNLHGPMPSLSGAAYHCQQAAEKLVKALLVQAGLAFPKTHDIAALVGLLSDSHRLKKALNSLTKLTPYGVAYRYPAEDEWDVPSTETIEAWRSEIEALRQSFNAPLR